MLNLQGKRQNGRQAKLPTTRHASSSVQCTQHLQYSAHSTCKLKKNTSSSRNDERVKTARDDERVHHEKRRTCSPRESTNEFHREKRRTCFTARYDERVHHERRRTCSPLIVSLECESVLKRKVPHHKLKETGEDSFSDSYSCSNIPNQCQISYSCIDIPNQCLVIYCVAVPK